MKILNTVSLTALLASVVSLVQGEKTTDLTKLDYRVYPRRTAEEAAVLEWGHSAIISALDASVAHFGPQTSQAALLEVECMPVLASPINGAGKYPTDDQNEDGGISVKPLDNADDVHGNMVVMTNNGGLSGVQMARVAKLSGAAALLVVNIDESRPDDIYRLELLRGEDASDIDIPVVMISLNSANVLTTATVTPGMSQQDAVNHGMPERVRLYAGGDRPFFEDVEPIEPTLYLIHNLLSQEEAKILEDSAKKNVLPVQEEDDILQLSFESFKYVNIERTMLWQGMLQTPAMKAVEERIEQVTGFPQAHFSDFIIDKFSSGSYWRPHYDTHPTMIPMATITVFLTANVNDNEGISAVYPSCSQPVKIVPHVGMAIVHHNTNERHELDMATLHAMLPSSGDDKTEYYVARKYVFTTPISTARRIALPFFAFPFGGRLPSFIISFHDFLVEKTDLETGGFYFDKACVFVPLLLVLLLVQLVVDYVQGGASSSSKKNDDSKKKDTNKEKKES